MCIAKIVCRFVIEMGETKTNRPLLPLYVNFWNKLTPMSKLITAHYKSSLHNVVFLINTRCTTLVGWSTVHTKEYGRWRIMSVHWKLLRSNMKVDLKDSMHVSMLGVDTDGVFLKTKLLGGPRGLLKVH